MDDYQEYLRAIDATQLAHPEWRRGQTHFNVLEQLDPELAEEVRGGDLDPYYRDDRADWLCAHVSIVWARRRRAALGRAVQRSDAASSAVDHPPRVADAVGTVTDRPSLVAAMAAGWRPPFVAFWDPVLPPGADVGPGVLCQWWPAAFEVDGRRYLTAEHWMMAEKARRFGDHETAEAVLAAETPAEAKALGREARGFDSAVWRRERTEVVVAGNLAKFGQHPDLGTYLLWTGDAVIVEANPVDTTWGAGVAEDDPRLTDPERWPGENLLGFALMQVRARLRERD